MEVLENIRWFSNENTLSASLMRFHASIHVHKNQNKLVFQVQVTDENMDRLIITFPTLEEAFSFIHSVVNDSLTLQEIIDKCNDVYNGKVPKIKKRSPIKTNGNL